MNSSVKTAALMSIRNTPCCWPHLDAQRSNFVNDLALTETSIERQIALVDLFRALGGGWTGKTELYRDSEF